LENIEEIVKLMIDSTNNNPYKGKLTKIENIEAAIELAKLSKDFADKGYSDEAMNISSKDWQKIIEVLKEK